MIPADVKANKNNKNKRSGGLSYKCLSLKYNVKGTYIFISFWLVFYPFQFCLLETGGSAGDFWLSDKILLRKMRVIC